MQIRICKPYYRRMHMLVLGGVAESMENSQSFNKGEKHEYILFCKDHNLADQLENIETYFNDKGWDNIVINREELIDDDSGIEHETLANAYKLADENGLSAAAISQPLN